LKFRREDKSWLTGWSIAVLLLARPSRMPLERTLAGGSVARDLRKEAPLQHILGAPFAAAEIGALYALAAMMSVLVVLIMSIGSHSLNAVNVGLQDP
jgi:hypothetical protein